MVGLVEFTTKSLKPVIVSTFTGTSHSQTLDGFNLNEWVRIDWNQWCISVEPMGHRLITVIA